MKLNAATIYALILAEAYALVRYTVGTTLPVVKIGFNYDRLSYGDSDTVNTNQTLNKFLAASNMWIDYLSTTYPNLLPGAAVQIISLPNEDSAASGITTTNQLIQTSMVVGLVGSTYSSISKASSILSAAFNVPQCDGSSTSPELSNKNIYPLFFRTCPSDELQGKAIFDYIYQQGWRRASAMYETEAYGTGLFTVFTNYAATYTDFTVISSYQLPITPTGLTVSSWTSRLARMKADQVFIITLFGASTTFLYLAQAATAAGMKNEKYVWIGSDAMYDVSQLAVQEGFVVFNPSEGTTCFEIRHRRSIDPVLFFVE